MDHFPPLEAAAAERIHASFAKQGAMTTVGARLTHLARGQVHLCFDWAPALTQQHGFIHAGMMATVLDSACGYAGLSVMPLEAGVLSIEFKINLLAPARGQYFHFLGRVIKPGRTITVCDGEAWGFDDGKKTLIATMHGTIMALFDRPGLD